jgi:PKD repeat protein
MKINHQTFKNLVVLFVLFLGCSSAAQIQDSLILRPDTATSKDAIVWSINPTTNYGVDQQATLTAWTYQGNFSIKRYYVAFDLTQLPPTAIVDSAVFNLYNNPSAPSHNGLHSGSNEFVIRRVTTPWSDTTITWNNQPSHTTSNQVGVPATTSNTQDFSLDVTNLVLDQLTYGNHGFFLQLQNESTFRAVVCGSAEVGDTTNRPMLKVYYHLCPIPTAVFLTNKSGFTLDLVPLFNPANAQHFWDFGNGDTSTLDTVNYTYSTPGIYNVCHIITTECGADTTCETVTLCDAPNVEFGLADNGLTVTFNPQDTSSLSYWWDFGDGSFSNLRNPVHTYPASGTYTVCFSAYNDCGGDTLCQTIFVSGLWMPENSGEFVLYPNPGSDFFRLERTNGEGEILGLELYAISGQLLREFDPNSALFFVQDLPVGTYSLKIIESERSFVVPFVKN